MNERACQAKERPIMTELYSQAEAEQMARRARRVKTAAWALLGLAFAVCVILCTRVKTGNAERLYVIVAAVSALSGWIAFPLLALAYRPCRAQYEHMAGILACKEGETLEGKLTVSPDGFQIPKSIVVHKAALTDGENTLTLNVNEQAMGKLPPNGTRVRLRAVRRYITGIEPLEEQ